MRPNQQERGFALVGAVFALVVIASLIAGAFFASMQEVSIGRSSQTYQRAFDAAEGGVAMRVASWAGQAGTLNNLAVGASVTYVDTLPDRRSVATSNVQRLNSMLYLIGSVGGSGTSSRQLGAIAKLQLANLNIKASLTTRASLTIGGSSFIDGRNTNPNNWGCPSVNDTLAGVRTANASLITVQGGGQLGIDTYVEGTPTVLQDTTVKDTTFTNFGGISYWDLAAMATITFNGNVPNSFKPAPDTAAGRCTTSGSGNWGEPWRPPSSGYIALCINYFPIIHVAGTVTVVNGVTTVANGTGNLSLAGGRGQGILLVDGDVTVDGGFEFYGPVIALGHFTTQGQGGHFNGGVMAADVNLELNTVLGNALVTYSSCTILRAPTASANARLLKERRWMDLTQ